MAKWLIDPGHGGSDPGACYKGRRECDDVLRLSKRVGEILSANGESVSFTRTSDATLSLTQRSNIENKGSYDYFVSVHRNAVGAEVARGVETHIYNGSYPSKETCRSLASKVNTNLVGVGFVDRKVKESNFHVLRETRCPAILIETGFIDHSTDNGIFDSKFEQIAQAIAKGCLAQVGKNMSTDSGKPSNPAPSKELYRIRKSWADAASQIGAYSDLANAKAVCDKNPGYSVFNSAGTKVYPVTPVSSCDKVITAPYTEVGGYGTATITVREGIKFRDKYCTHCGVVQGTYEYGESVRYDKVCITEKYTWISWIGASTGTRRWMPIKDRRTGEVWANCV